ncbi:hypothetical protein BDF20DRAFT_914482 [Mycotypha africana]|uniref:uncharacterized protein n=1 Tax=Mycotypha africana TaxID=64632 RepID=UPI0023012E5F|nr:uncharacterized protein BDF20DRAFT_914482 [Mycotypha africana]KAI8975586.1 hypothetical protein BDF20DRAFT_914482 [Mycotypha africana]
MENFQQLEILETGFQIAHATYSPWVKHLKNLEVYRKNSSFVNLKNIRTLLMVTEAFWRLYQPVNDEELWKTKRRPTYPAIYSLIDATKDRHRFCVLQFE